MTSEIFSAPPGTGRVADPVTLPSLLYNAAEKFPNPKALMQRQGEEWVPYSSQKFLTHSEEIAAGLRNLGLERGEKVAFFLDSDAYFAISDMGCLIAGLINVPIYLTHKKDQIQYVLKHSEAKALIVADEERLAQIADLVGEAPNVEHVIVAHGGVGKSGEDLPDSATLQTLESVREKGRPDLNEKRDLVQQMRGEVDVDDLATIIYTSGTTGKPKGVMLTHANISYNGMTAFSGLEDYVPGAGGEVVLSFLPLTHIFARAIHYGFVAHGTTVYFTDTERLGDDLRAIRPTLFATVPRLLEKVYGRIQERTENMTGVKKILGTWALNLARQYEVGKEPSVAAKAQLSVADTFVFKKWREALGGRVKYIISGGAALNKDLANLFAAAGVTILEGYGLTETSPVIAFNRPGRNRPGTVGEPLPGTEVKIADDGEILSRGPGTMKGYFKEDQLTDEVIDDDGWFHTGDIGEISADGYLRITDRKKDLFKLSTGKYVTPSPLENALTTEPLIEQAVVVGSGQKFCGALIFPNEDSLRAFARNEGLDAEQPFEALVKEDKVEAKFQELVTQANQGVDPWSTIKRVTLVPDEVTVESGLLTPTMKIRRPVVRERYGKDIQELFERTGRERREKQGLSAT